MKEQLADLVAFKVIAAVTAAGSVLFSGGGLAGLYVPFFGVNVSTLGMAAAGSLIAFAYGEPITERRKLYGYAIGGIFVGVWCVQVLPSIFGLEWMSPKLEPPMAGVFALVSRWAVPLVIEHLPEAWRRLTNSRKESP